MAASSSLQGVQMLGSVGEILNVRNTLSVPAGDSTQGIRVIWQKKPPLSWNDKST